MFLDCPSRNKRKNEVNETSRALKVISYYSIKVEVTCRRLTLEDDYFFARQKSVSHSGKWRSERWTGHQIFLTDLRLGPASTPQCQSLPRTNENIFQGSNMRKFLWSLLHDQRKGRNLEVISSSHWWCCCCCRSLIWIRLHFKLLSCICKHESKTKFRSRIFFVQQQLQIFLRFFG